MATVLDTIETRYKANIIDFEREVARMQKISSKAAERIASDQNRQAASAKSAWQKADIGGALQKSMSSGVTGATAELAKLAPALAAAFAGNAAIGAADTYNRFTNNLKVAGLEGVKLAEVQDHLYAAALKNGAALEPLGQLYGRVSQSAKELGLSSSGVLTITDAVAAAVRVSGGSAEEASGALLQLSQALASGTVRAEEFNSINEGLLPLLQAAAGASEKYGGSVAKMRADVLKGGLSSAEFAKLIEAGLGSLEGKAAKASLTVEQAMQNVQTALIKGISTVDQTYGATQKLTGALTWLSQNLDILGKSLIVLGGIFAVSMAPAIGRAGIALGTYTAEAIGAGVASARLAAFQVTMAASMRGTTVATETAAMAMRGLMSSTGVGLAIVAVTAALGLFAAKSMEAAEAERQFQGRLEAARAAKAEAAKASHAARVATGDLTSAEKDALQHTANLTKEANKLADARYREAAATKAARLEELLKNTGKTGADVIHARQNLARATVGREFSTNIYSPGMTAPQQGPVKDSADVTQKRKDLTTAEEANAAAWKDFYAEQNRKLVEYIPKPTPGTTKPDKGAAGRERRGDTAIEAAETDLRNATRGLAYTREEQHQAALTSLKDEYDQHVRKLDEAVEDKQLSGPDAEIAKGKYKKAYNLKVQAEDAAYQRDLDQQTREVTARDLDTKLEGLRVQEDDLRSLASHAATIKDKQSYEAAALAKRQEADKLSFVAQQDQLRLDLKKLGLTKDEIDARVAARQSVFNDNQAGERKDLVTSQGDELPSWSTWLKNLGTDAEVTTQKLQGVAANGLNGLADGIADAVTGAKSLKAAFADTAKAIIADLVKIAVKMLIFKALGNIFPGFGKIANVSVAKNAAGTNYFGGGLSIVGEAGPELVAMPRGAQVAPNNLLKRALQTPTGSGNSTVVNNYAPVIHADGAVMAGWVKEEVYKGMVQAVQTSRQASAQDSVRTGRNRL
ncbi:tape measure protein [Caulobacter sp. UC70_42]|uniref:tape measure protein n=1 Tax=Caulobacter sp. UC70_42 TaxID=3374551 RepID=UPI003756AFC7